MSKKVELLAPAGNKESFYAAIYAGADAVYLAGKEYGARAYADNFSAEDICECLSYAHLFNKKIYLTVNTLMKQDEIDHLVEFIEPLYEAGLDGVIVQDLGALSILGKNFPGLELHASTQMTICDSHGVEALKELGVCRVVPARELSLKEIVDIKNKTGMALETFIHGAMCYCYSGQCLFSSILGGRSGNRGRCAQPCRLPYEATINQKKYDKAYPLSLKDMCTIENIPELIEAGIDSFKIEGRMKRPEYVAGVTAIYRKYIDLYYSNGKIKVSKEDLTSLSNLYIRSETGNGYYYKHNGSDMVTLNNPSYNKSDEALLARLQEKYLDKYYKCPINMSVRLLTGEKAKLYIDIPDTDYSVTCYGDEVQKASNRPITDLNVKKQLSKLGDTYFEINNLEIELSNDAFYPLGAINELRRNACSELLLLLTRVERFSKAPSNKAFDKAKNDTNSLLELSFKYSVSVLKFEQLKALIDYKDIVSNIYVDINIIDDALISYIKDNFLAIAGDIRLYILLPTIIRNKDIEKLKEILDVCELAGVFEGIVVKSIDGLGFVRSLEFNWKIIADDNLYCWNSEAKKTLIDIFGVNKLSIPIELNSKEVTNEYPGCSDKLIYGRLPMMVTANCICNTLSGCNKNCEDRVTLKDRYNTVFYVQKNCKQCFNIIYNSVPLSLHNYYKKYQGRYNLKLSFTTENEANTKDVLTYFSVLYKGKEATPPYKDFTTGHEKRGVE